MLRSKLPDTPPAPTAHLITSAVEAARHDYASATALSRPASTYLRPVGVGVAAVAVVGLVLTALLATVAVTAVSVSIAALVLRSLLSGTHHR